MWKDSRGRFKKYYRAMDFIPEEFDDSIVVVEWNGRGIGLGTV
jgi:hypothetical protein